MQLNKQPALQHAARTALISYLNVQPEENILLLYDDTTMEIAKAFIAEAQISNFHLQSEKMPPSGGHGIEPSNKIAELMKQYNVVIAATEFSLTHTDATRNACKADTRVATLPGINSAIFAEGLAANPLDLNKTGSFWVEKMQGGKNIRITTEQGTDISFTTGKYLPMNDDGIIDKPGIYGNLPAGEAFIAPDELSANGTVVFDGTIGGQENNDLTSPVILTLKNGSISDFGETKTTPAGKIRAEKLKQTLAPFGEAALLLAEFGIGTNTKLKMSGNLLGDEKLTGTIHLAFGNNCSMGGENNVKVHIDCLMQHPKIFIDGQHTQIK